MTIQWFPGHMAKARKEIESHIKLVDIVIELVDARAPMASQNPMLQQMIHQKQKIIILMKKDLADDKETSRWIRYFEEKGIPSIAINANEKQDIAKVIKHVDIYRENMHEKMKAKGIVQPRALRAMILGIPNVGKSTLINRLAKKKIAQIGNRPGITKHQQWIKVKKQFELLDTPGVLWPKFDDQEIAKRLAAIGTIKDTILSLQDVAAYVLSFLQHHYPELYEERFSLDPSMEDMWEIFESIGKQRGALESGGQVNFDIVAEQILYDLRSGRIGKISFERIEDYMVQ
ncbi:MAG TPA: ribosome biogenesis GTPase YlqF [Bacillota bacterium]|nr:ribosome biogenesis GTPase YlqF [Bacillota bacterium]